MLCCLTPLARSAQAARPERALSTDVSGHITENTVWTLANSPYVVTGDVTVDEGVTLTIEAGVVVKFNHWRRTLVVDGSLIAEGEPAQPIVFTSILDDDPAHGGDTNGDGSATNGDGSATSSGSLEHVWVGYGGDAGTASRADIEIRGTSDESVNNAEGVYIDDIVLRKSATRASAARDGRSELRAGSALSPLPTVPAYIVLGQEANREGTPFKSP